MKKLISIIMASLVLFVSGCATKTSSEPAPETFEDAVEMIKLDPNWQTDDYSTLSLRDEKTQITIAHILVATSGWTTDDPEILKLRAEDDVTVAHVQASFGQWQTQDKEILMLKDTNDSTVAHILAFSNFDWTTDDEDILSMAVTVDSKEYTVGYVLEMRSGL